MENLKVLKGDEREMTRNMTVREVLNQKYWIARPLPIIQTEEETVRLNIVTDDIEKKSLLGGVATSLILATQLCLENDWSLRIITRYTPCNLDDYYHFLKVQNLKKPKFVEGFSDERRDNNAINYKMPVGKNDIFMATSWWSAKSILDLKIRNRILYIIQEEETFFYPYGDERYWCEYILRDKRIDFIVNSKLLMDYFCNHGYQTLCDNALYFEPAFPEHIYFADTKTFQPKIDEKRRIFFYGRPNNPRNLYYLGLECIDEAIERGILDTDLWDIYMAGSNDIKTLAFTNGYVPKLNGQMSWEDYAAFCRTIDLAISLMYTPHPSYPPFDMCCSGAVVLTNEFANKKALSYSDNMLLVPLEKEAIISGIKIGMDLAVNLKSRQRNYENMKICRDWNKSLHSVVQIISERARRKEYV